MIYCDKYLSLDSLVLTKDKFDPTIKQLRSIRETVATLLSSKRIKEILSTAISSSAEVDNLFDLMLRRIQIYSSP
jgi:5-methylcytosine-specific restriction endonuclease McrBC regulatory subunit McrC